MLGEEGGAAKDLDREEGKWGGGLTKEGRSAYYEFDLYYVGDHPEPSDTAVRFLALHPAIHSPFPHPLPLFFLFLTFSSPLLPILLASLSALCIPVLIFSSILLFFNHTILLFFPNYLSSLPSQFLSHPPSPILFLYYDVCTNL